METLLERRDGAIVTLTLNRPEKRNALDQALVTALRDKVKALDDDPSVACVILTGAGDKAFAAGADIAAMAEMTPAQAKALSELGHAAGTAMEEAHFPVLGAVNGFALGGGCELALACDFLYASDKAQFGQPEVNLGVIPGFGGTQRLLRRVGVARARELCFTGAILSAEDALRSGLVNAVVPHAELLPKVNAVAQAIASKGPLAIRACKRVIHEGQDLPLAQANARETAAFAELFSTSDQREGMAAFLGKRAAVFTGK